jgi:Fe-S cluster biogenesis protein NfuA|tara:strand:+ start:3898 stop:4266 length:369 start_codon:yes stop_codon:yes gene_type:complete
MDRTKEQILHDIESVIEKYIKSQVESHGGQVEAKEFDVDTGKLTMLMKGACSGCAGSTATLQKGIESTMKHYVPEVKQVVGEDDPNSTTKPYYDYNPWDGPTQDDMLDELDRLSTENNNNEN